MDIVPGKVYYEDVGTVQVMERRLNELRSAGWEVVSTESVSDACYSTPSFDTFSRFYVHGPGIRIRYRKPEPQP